MVVENRIETFEQYKGDCSEADLAIVLHSLQELAALPEEEWDVEPEDYDGEHPELFPPSVEMEYCAYGDSGRRNDVNVSGGGLWSIRE